MSTPTTAPPLPARSPGTWSLTWNGLRTVAVLELRQRVRSTRWKVALIVWFVVVGGITLLTSGAMNFLFGSGNDEPAGPAVFGLVVFFVLFLGLLVAPTLSATTINGDRNAGTLATLQITLLSPAEIVLGKLAAAWLAALAFLAASIPFIVWALLLGGVRVIAMITTLLILAFLLAVTCAIGLGFSALVSKTSGSAVLSYLTVAALSLGTLILFGLTVPLVTTEETVVQPYHSWDSDSVSDSDSDSDSRECVTETVEREVAHTERTWWLLAINPFVIVADAAPEAISRNNYSASSDPLAGIREGVRMARMGPAGDESCEDTFVDHRESATADQPPVWPWGLAANLLFGAGGIFTAVRRLRIPTEQLPRGTRVA